MKRFFGLVMLLLALPGCAGKRVFVTWDNEVVEVVFIKSIPYNEVAIERLHRIIRDYLGKPYAVFYQDQKEFQVWAFSDDAHFYVMADRGGMWVKPEKLLGGFQATLFPASHGCETGYEHWAWSLPECLQRRISWRFVQPAPLPRIWGGDGAHKSTIGDLYDAAVEALGEPSYEGGFGINHSEWWFDNGKVLHLASLPLYFQIEDRNKRDLKKPYQFQ